MAGCIVRSGTITRNGKARLIRDGVVISDNLTVESLRSVFPPLLLGIGVLGLLIGGLSLANTVTAAVFERIRDFGIKRALGATDLDLLGEVLGEGIRVSLWGGGAGVLLAWSIGTAVDARMLRDGEQLFLFSPRLLAFALVFSLALGALAAGYATLRIARLSPAEAIRRGS